MNIAVLGTGSVGQALSARLDDLGHNVYMGTRNVANSLGRTGNDSWGNPQVGAWIQDHGNIQLVTFEEAVERGGDLIVFAMNGMSALDALEAVDSALFDDKVMMDITNPLDFSNGFPPSLSVSNTDSLAEQIQKAYPRMKVVKTLNTMSNPVMVNPKAIAGDHTVFLSGNDEKAKGEVADVLRSFGWEDKNMIDLGDISTARGTEMILPLWVRLYGKLQTPMFNFHVNIAE